MPQRQLCGCVLKHTPVNFSLTFSYSGVAHVRTPVLHSRKLRARVQSLTHLIPLDALHIDALHTNVPL
jgi:hypothetical protein